MKVAILYATKTGTAEKAAKRLAELFAARGDEATVTNLADSRPDLAAVDAVVLGGSVRIGRWHKRAVAFARQNETTLINKPLALYACRCGSDDVRQMLGKQIGEPLAAHAVFADGVGGEMKLESQKGFDHFVVAQILKSGKNDGMKVTGLLDERLNALADALVKATAQ